MNVAGWRAMLRLARRDAVRARGRSLLVLAMITLPVLGVTAADVVIATYDVSSVESLPGRLGAADARVGASGAASVEQAADPDEGMGTHGTAGRQVFTLATVAAALGRPVTGIERREGDVRVVTDAGVARAYGTEVDLGDPLAAGLFELTDGRWPHAPDEVVVNADLVARGVDVGETVSIEDSGTAVVVGVAESPTRADPQITGLPGAFGLPSEPGTATFLVEADGGISWADVRALNSVGAAVLSREVVTQPPPEAEISPFNSGSDDAMVAVVILIVVMALLEVVLLAGPAFAVGARRQTRTLALVASSGGTPKQLRRIVLASAVVLGSIAAILGVLGGIGIAYASLPLVQRLDDQTLGPFDVPWLHLVGIAAFGLVSAVLAALAPAVLAARQDVVKVLAGRRGDPRPTARSPLLGLLLLGIGIAGSVHGASRSELYIAVSAVPVVLGMVLLVPVVVAGLARVSRPLPFALRYALRDAARHRTRTAPAVAAVAATVAGVVAFGIGAASDESESQATYEPTLLAGHGAVTSMSADADWAAAEQAAAAVLPAEQVHAVTGLPQDLPGRGPLEFEASGVRDELLDGYYSPLGASVLVSPDTVPPGLLSLDEAQQAAALRVLADGGAVIATNRPVSASEVTVQASRPPRRSPAGAPSAITVPAVFVQAPGSLAGLQAVVSPAVAEALDLTPRVVGLALTGPLPPQTQQDVEEAVNAVLTDASVYVERGYQREGATTIALLVLGVLGGLLMLGGTLTATFLALSDARPDLATLAAVGARPRSRRTIAAGYAATIGLVGALLGAAVGFVPGIAITYPLTGNTGGDADAPGGQLPDHFLDVPWTLVLSVVVLLPLLTAAIVALLARSRLPMTARMD